MQDARKSGGAEAQQKIEDRGRKADKRYDR